MTDFLETPRFPDCVSFGATGGPGYQTDVVIVNSGAEQRNQVWSQARAVYEVSHAARLPSQYGPLRDFFRVVKGKTTAFRFKDWTDFTVSSGQGVFVMLTSTTFQMYRRYTAGSTTEDRIVQKPISGTVTVTGGSGATVNYTTGIVTVSGGTPTAWVGEFDVPCRFDTDEMRGEIINRNVNEGLIIGWNSIPLIEVRL